MRMVYLIYNSGIDDDINDILQRLNITGYTKILVAHGSGGAGRKLGIAIWPGANNVLLMVMPEEQIEPLVEAVAQLKNSFSKNPGISIFSVPAEIHGEAPVGVPMKPEPR
ncbi:MAG: hypothetical protein HY318_05975 [Armatimonadetes bacterium]|nr:hypothetical protein [Armatimonadota bacterium]